jgi:hypothetical protein
MFKTQLWKLFCVSLVALTACSCAFAQYGGGGGAPGGAGSPSTSTSPSYGHGAAIGAAVGAAAAGATVLYLVVRHQREVVGCVGPDGKTLTADHGKRTYALVGNQMTAGEHLSIVGKKIKNASGGYELQVKSVKKHLGQCEEQTGLAKQHP